MFVQYIPSQTNQVQGNSNEIFKQYGKEWKISELGKGNGNWLLTKKSDVLVNGVSYRYFVLEHYNKKKLTEKLVKKFREDLENGNIKLPSINN